MKKYKCPCCGYYTLNTLGEYDICPVCYWEDDPFQRMDEILADFSNKVSLVDARINYRQFGACEADMLKYVRKPTHDEFYGLDD